MAQALKLAEKGLGFVSPNPMVGAVIVKNGIVVAEGWHRCFGGDHAEIEALKKAGAKAKGATLYVTLEPCHHYGKTPPCVNAIIASGIKRVVVAMKDPNPLTNGKSLAKMKKAGLQVSVGILRDDAQKLNESFITYIRAKKPFVVLKMAQTLDGKIASSTGNSKWITDEKTRIFSKDQRKTFDAILVGINTILKDDSQLNAPGKKNFKKIILDTTLKIALKARLLAGTSAANCIIATTKKHNKNKMKQLKDKGAEVIVCPLKDKGVDLKWLMRELARRSIGRVLIEGGSHVAGSALKAKVVDKIQIYLAPKILGDQNALSAISGLNVLLVDQAVQLKDVQITQFNSDILIEGYVHRNN